MEFIVRPLQWEKIDKEGVPHDAICVMDYFNGAIKDNDYPLVPRKTRITRDEILDLWVPAKDKNISIVATRLDGYVVGCGTILVDKDSNRYVREIQEKTGEKRASGEYHITIDPKYIGMGIGTAITGYTLKEAKSREIKVLIHTSIDNKRMIGIMEKLGYKPKTK